MPTIAYFLGIAYGCITMTMSRRMCTCAIRVSGARADCDGSVIDGRLPTTTARLMKEWTDLRRDALMQNWRAAETTSRWNGSKVSNDDRRHRREDPRRPQAGDRILRRDDWRARFFFDRGEDRADGGAAQSADYFARVFVDDGA